MLTTEQLESWKKNGFLLIKQFYTSEEQRIILQKTNEMENWDEIPGKWMKYYEKEVDEKNLTRIENYLDYDLALNSLLNGQKVKNILKELMGEEAVLFKDKINFKKPGGGGFEPHQDAPAFAVFGQIYHITISVPVDQATLENGCLEMSPGNHKGPLPKEEDGTLCRKLEKQLNWEPLKLEIGDIVFFDSYIPHRSHKNVSDKSRRAFFITYNKSSEGDVRSRYYEEKRKAFPPDYEKVPGKDYSQNHYFNLGNPIKN